MKPHPYRRISLSILMVLATVAIPISAVDASTQPKEARCRKYEPMLRKAGLPVRQFSAIMWRESKCVPQAIGWNYYKGKSHLDCKLSHARTYRKCAAVRSYDVGLLQINSSWKTVTAKICKSKFGDMLVLQDPKCNIKVARYLYKHGGLQHWHVTSGKP